MTHTSSHKASQHLPNLVVIGAMKCATTSLHYYLGLHPEIFMSQEKELNFYSYEGNWHKGVGWYASHFLGEAKIRGESSPNYANYPFSRGVPQRMHALVPEAKLIYIVRDPIDRIISHYVHQYAVGREHRSLSEALANLEDNPYVCRSTYFMQLKQYLKYFPESSILIIRQEDLASQRKETLTRVFRFLKVDDGFYCKEFLQMKHESRGKRRKRHGLPSLRPSSENVLQLLPPCARRSMERSLLLSFSREVKRPVLDDRLRQRLMDFLEEDVHCFTKVTRYDCEPWHGW